MRAAAKGWLGHVRRASDVLARVSDVLVGCTWAQDEGDRVGGVCRGATGGGLR
jgi:hypothetical protein